MLSDQSERHVPLYSMDKTKFLVPILPWGPVEQLRGFRESLLMAFYLNRTLCVPPFWREKAQNSLKVKKPLKFADEIFFLLNFQGFNLNEKFGYRKIWADRISFGVVEPISKLSFQLSRKGDTLTAD